MNMAMAQASYQFTVGGLSLHVSAWGPAQGRPLLALHGIRGFGELRGLLEDGALENAMLDQLPLPKNVWFDV